MLLSHDDEAQGVPDLFGVWLVHIRDGGIRQLRFEGLLVLEFLFIDLLEAVHILVLVLQVAYQKDRTPAALACETSW